MELVITADAEELATGVVLDLGASGTETRDGTTMTAAPPGAVVLLAYFDDLAAAERAAERASEVLGEGCSAATAGTIEDPGWRVAWRDHFGPMRFGDRLWVAPPDEAIDVGTDEVVVTLVPAAAFGTGTHETTSLMLDLVSELVRPGQRVLDVGCGSGILALAAVRLGAAEARGIDVDQEAVDAALGNARQNDLSDRATFDATPLESVEETWDVVLANLSIAELPPLVPDLAARVAPGGVLVWSGLLREHASEVPPPPGLTLVEERGRGEWVAQIFRLAGSGQ